MAGKQAKTLTEKQVRRVLAYVGDESRYPHRDRVMILLSVKAGLRAAEIAGLSWSMVTDSDGNVGDHIALADNIAKKGSGRTIPLNAELRAALVDLKRLRDRDGKGSPDMCVIHSERGKGMSAQGVTNWFFVLYNERVFFDGCSSHSGRRSFITNAARKITEAGGSLRDVQQLAGHANLGTTQAYIEGSTDAKRKLVNLI